MIRNQIFKSFVVTLIAVFLLATPVIYAQPQVKIKSLFLVGKGFSVSPTDLFDFKLAKIGIASVEATSIKSLRIGILELDEDKYRIRNVTKEEGKVSGYLYSNKTKVGEFELTSVMKENTEVWVGTLSLSGSNYNLYIVQGVRKIKPVELKDKIAEYCKANRNDPNCRARMEEYCKNNPNDARCKEIFRRYCINNSEDMRCREYIINYCSENPEKRECRLLKLRLSARYCEKNPDSKYCLNLSKELVEYCLKNPEREKCRNFCSKYPDKCLKVVKSLADFCIENPNHTKCIDYCKKHKKACVRLSASTISLCAKNPNSEKCIEYCKAHPVACKIVSAELARYCIGRENDIKCRNYCKEHPVACKGIAVNLEGYCSKHKDKPGCKIFCSKFPNKCAVEKPVIVEENIKKVGPVKISREVASIVTSVNTNVKVKPSMK